VATAKGEEHIYYIEVKDRWLPNTKGEFKMGWSPSTEAVIAKAVEQWTAMPKQKGAVFVLWVNIREDDEDETVLESLWHTLYGVQEVEVSRGNIKIRTACFYLNPSAFRKWPDLAATIISTGKGLVFCLNQGSHSDLRRSRLFSLYKRVNGVMEPDAIERDKGCLIAQAGRNEEERMKSTMTHYGFESMAKVHGRITRDFRIIRLPAGGAAQTRK